MFPDRVFQDLPSAFTIRKGYLELSGRYLLVNDTVDVLNVRETRISGRDLFEASVGDYSGLRGILNYGLTHRLMFHYAYQSADLDTSLGTSSTFRGLDSTRSLSTTSHDARLRLNLLGEDGRIPALALEAGYILHDSEDTGISFTGITAGNTRVDFLERESIRLGDLRDDGFQFRLLASRSLAGFLPSAWVGYNRYRVETRISTSIDLPSIRDNFDRTIDSDEDIFSLGLGLGIRYIRRLPLHFSYEYLAVNRRTDTDEPLNSSILARFSNPQDTPGQNHVFCAHAAYWLTPRLNIHMDARLFLNHFLGIIPHYSNPFTAGFFDNTYGYLGIGVGFVF
jgi:hypothetical protein